MVPRSVGLARVVVAHDVGVLAVGPEGEGVAALRDGEGAALVGAVAAHAAVELDGGQGLALSIGNALNGHDAHGAASDVEPPVGGLVGQGRQHTLPVEPLHAAGRPVGGHAHAAGQLDLALIDGVAHPQAAVVDGLAADDGHIASAADDVDHHRLGIAVGAGEVSPLPRGLAVAARGRGIAHGEACVEEIHLAQERLLQGGILQDGGLDAQGGEVVNQFGKLPDGRDAHLYQFDVRPQLVGRVVLDARAPLGNAVDAEVAGAVGLVLAKQTRQRRLVAAPRRDVQPSVLQPLEFVLARAVLVLARHRRQELLAGKLLFFRLVVVAPQVVHQVDAQTAA